VIQVKDASHFEGHAERIVFPTTEEQIAQLLRKANETKIPVTVSGGGTGLTGARVPLGGILLSTERMNRILKIRWDPLRRQGAAILQPGVELKDFEKALEKRGLFYPPDPGEKTAFIGGTVATNASGPRSFKYGPTRRYVRRLRVVLPNGKLLELSRGKQRLDKKVGIPIPTYPMPLTKNAAGYYVKPKMDLIDLFIGSEGTLGVFTEVELAILKAPESVMSGILFFASEKECFYFSKKRTSRLQPRLLEFFDARSLALLSKKHPQIPARAQAALFFEQECRKGKEEVLRQAWVRAIKLFQAFPLDPWISHHPRTQAFYREFRHDLPVLVNTQVRKNGFRKIGTDLAVPEKSAEAMFDFYLKKLGSCGIDFCVFGHLGDNNLHVNFLPKTRWEFERALALYRTLAKKAVELRGTVSAEHGIGKVRIPYLELMVGKKGLKEMARVKKAFDPNGILNPGNLFPVELLREV